MNPWSLKKKLIALVVVILSLTVLSSMGLQLWINRNSLAIIKRGGSNIETMAQLKKIQMAFAKEVQEWKNLLIRGSDLKDREKYSAAFQESAEKVLQLSETLKGNLASAEHRKDMDDFIEQQRSLLNMYLASRDKHMNSSVFEPQTSDKELRGKDR